MRLKVLVPDRVLVDEEVTRVVAWARDGSFCLLPRHIDFVSALAPGLLTFEVDEEYAEFLAIDEGVLVKKGAEVMIATRNAVSEPELEKLKASLEEKIRTLETRERDAREVIARMEAEFAEQYLKRTRHDDD